MVESKKKSAVCFDCKKRGEHNHHVVPKSRGGTETVMLCAECHAKVHGESLLSTSALTKIGMQKLIAKGLHTGGLPAYGYRVLDQRLVEHVEEQKVIKIIVALSNVMSYKNIADALTKQGLKTRWSDSFSLSTVKRIMARWKKHNE
jgi:hypothetical protein